MLLIEILKTILIGIVQGITEWLPISSTGHMILVDEFVKLSSSKEFIEMFFVVIQFGSILAVVFLFFHRLNPFSPKKSSQQRRDTISLWLKVAVAAFPAAIIGLLFDNQIDTMFYNPITVAVTLVLYGVLFIILENRKVKPKIGGLSELDYKTALYIGIFQVLALIPGTSRSGATILGAVFLGCSRYIASEFSFFLAIPIMFGASLLKMYKFGLSYSGQDIIILVTGMVTAFIVSIFAIRFLLDYIKRHDFKAFGYYRIVLGVIVLLYFILF